MILRAQISVWQDSLLPRDAMTINPHFNVRDIAPNVGALATDLCQLMVDTIPGTMQTQVKMYDAEDPPPSAPKGQKLLQTGTSPASTVPREIALCLSYYAGENVKRKRGRLYIPVAWLTNKTLDVRPGTAVRGEVLDYGNLFSLLGGANVDWGVWSRVTNSFDKTTNTYVDDEWDTVRSRGLRPTTRTLGTPSG